jgi:peptide chain release factor 2
VAIDLEALNAEAEKPDIWNDQAAAQQIMRERTKLETSLNQFKQIKDEFEDCLALVELAEEESDEKTYDESEKLLKSLSKVVKNLELESLLSGEADQNSCYVEVHAGAGGTEAQDWAEMLIRMYTRWADSHKYTIDWVEESPGDEAGLKSATICVRGLNAYGWLKTESGVHRLVRISPYDSSSRRHTSFASIWVYPVVDDTVEIDIQEKDLRTDTYRASGAGGQHVNRTDSAVRITHIPTGIVVQCQAERSQHRNRAAAMSMLRARLYESELQRREEEINAVNEQKADIGWGHQIRSYVLQPYQLVKDLRTNFEHTNPQVVLDGDLDDFMAAALAERIGVLGNIN